MLDNGIFKARSLHGIIRVMQKNMPVLHPVPERVRVCSGSFLKTVAVIAMLIDHIGAGIIYPMLLNGLTLFSLSRNGSIVFYRVLRGIGRTAFPVFCFLLVEGFFHTKNKKQYALNLFVFSLLSEIPFDLALVHANEWSNTLQVTEALRTNLDVYLKDQSVYCTLLLGFLVIWAIDTVFSYCAGIAKDRPALQTPAYVTGALFSFLAVLAGYFAADALYTDYSHKGVVLIVILYLLYRIRPLASGAGYVYITLFGTNEVWSLPGFLLMLFYSGKRGYIRGKMKYAFYAFYPVHLVLIYIVRTFIL